MGPGLLALALAPGLAICIFIYRKDKHNKEPIWMLLMAFVLGVLSIIPAIAVQLSWPMNIQDMGGQSTGTIAFFAYCIVAFSEETSKFLMIRFFLYPRKHFDDPFDGILYAVLVSMGFATIENVGYVYQYGLTTGIVRMFLSVPGHATFGVLMGYFIGLAKFKNSGRWVALSTGLLLAVLFHGTFDFFLFLGSRGLLAGGALVAFLVALYLSFKAIRKKQQVSAVYFEEKLRMAEEEKFKIISQDEPLK
jgi:RsiW-degrading membrane proteinase PrsW (M82 family)